MAHIWARDSKGEWALCRMAETVLSLTTDVDEPVRVRRDAKGDEVGTLMPCHNANGDFWVLITPAGSKVFVNGIPNLLGLRVLDDRDEILLPDGRRVYFSTEVLAAVTPFHGDGGKPVFCPRCQQPIEDGSPAVCCPNPSCGVWHHQSEELLCWTYAERCSLCPQPTSLDEGYQWTPEDMDNAA